MWPCLTVDGEKVLKLPTVGIVREVYFSLGNTPSKDLTLDCVHAICVLFDRAEKSAHVALYSFTEPRIAEAMLAAHRRGVEIVLVVDNLQSKGKAMAGLLAKLEGAGIAVHRTIRQKSNMHNKVGIFDGEIVCTGSFNWTVNASKRNDENLLVIEGKKLAADYEKYVFQRILKNEV